ncbi:TetR family transcriptional regulator [Dokdonia pacifica]|uniref:Transcriptional regulator, TetR family n=1 Tax=Dokdonia pacifica TaxID=1627892 RepID=A0A238ZEP5_9FLAO|nr:TetR/AcrR family transcriptional regulator [Dokdonia pacifica]GGG06096.1 TetR family transcriptional regulator [Dokdonia pacifica]SNR81975.1 transcriptional regulator, TetR family [Dokdonia pacifica]
MKQKILDQARLLYNAKGISNVTTRVICDQLKISLGSFSYHFPDKKRILQQLYEEILDENQKIYDTIQKQEPTINTYLDCHKALFLIQEKYKFFYLNLFEILTNHPKIKEAYFKNRIEETNMAKQVFLYYMQMGILKKDITESQIIRLINVGNILNNFWPIDSELSPKLNQTERLIHYMKICCGLLEPYLEEESRDEYHKYFKMLENKSM